MNKFLILLSATCCASPAVAWDAWVDGPDVFGKTRAVALEGGIQSRLVVQCESDGDLYLALTFPKKEFEDVTEQPADLYLAASDEAPMKFAAKLRAWNDSHAGVVSLLEGTDRHDVIAAISGATSKIKVGADIGGNKASENFSSRGSTAAMKKLIDGCKLSPIN